MKLPPSWGRAQGFHEIDRFPTAPHHLMAYRNPEVLFTDWVETEFWNHKHPNLSKSRIPSHDVNNKLSPIWFVDRWSTEQFKVHFYQLQ